MVVAGLLGVAASAVRATTWPVAVASSARETSVPVGRFRPMSTFTRANPGTRCGFSWFCSWPFVVGSDHPMLYLIFW